MAETRIPLDELPRWAQDMIIYTAFGLLEDPNAYAVPTGNALWFRLYAHGFAYTLYQPAGHVY